jgi:DNA-directed RNA polymerase specialized sigma24 family protein/CheY-like chemotaxis protein
MCIQGWNYILPERFHKTMSGSEKMTSAPTNEGLGAAVAVELPYLRRFARALTGSQIIGDRFAEATLETIIADPSVIGGKVAIKTGLFRTFHNIWSSSHLSPEDPVPSDSGLEQTAQWRLQGLSENSREALLLNAIEGFAAHDIAEILSVSRSEAARLIETARDEMGTMVRGDVLIIEDEAIIAMDLQSIVTGMGHRAPDIARTRDAAIRVGIAKAPDLILADVQLADKSSGIDAVNALLAALGDVPVIFITAFPERLLTGARPEPAFLITKPYSEEQVRAAVSQAMFFASTKGILERG